MSTKVTLTKPEGGLGLKCGDPPGGRNHPIILKIVEGSVASEHELLAAGNSVASVNGVKMTGKMATDVHQAVRAVQPGEQMVFEIKKAKSGSVSSKTLDISTQADVQVLDKSKLKSAGGLMDM